MLDLVDGYFLVCRLKFGSNVWFGRGESGGKVKSGCGVRERWRWKVIFCN